MLITLPIYPGQFQIEDSVDICASIEARIILPDAWVKYTKIPSRILPENFDLLEYANRNFLHVLIFTPPDPDFYEQYIHPDLLLKLIKRHTRYLYRREFSSNK